MRLSEKEKSAILEAIREEDPTAEVYLFGSRADDTRRGGDIDLLIRSESPNTQCQVYRPWGAYKRVVDSERFQVNLVTSSRSKNTAWKTREACRWGLSRRSQVAIWAKTISDRYGR